MNDNSIQDLPLMDLLTQNLESNDVKKFINSLDVTKDDDSAIQELKKSYEAYISNESLSTGDVVSWKPGMRNRTLPNYRQPAIVIEKMQYPIFDESQNAGSQYFHEPLDLRVGFWMTIIGSLSNFMILVDLKNTAALFLTSSVI